MEPNRRGEDERIPPGALLRVVVFVAVLVLVVVAGTYACERAG